MTEEEAKGKWCPMVRSVPHGVDPFQPEADPMACCIGSACMMWRWETKLERRKKDTRGYCGLAGTP